MAELKTKAKKSRAPKVAPTPEEVIFSENVPEQPEVSELGEPEPVEVELPDDDEEKIEQPEIESSASENLEDTGAETPTESLGNPESFLTESLGNPESLGDGAADTPGAHLYKLRPDVTDDKSKWAVQIKVGPNSYHRIFEGSLKRARIRAFNYNAKHGMSNIEIKQYPK